MVLEIKLCVQCRAMGAALVEWGEDGFAMGRRNNRGRISKKQKGA